MCGGALMRILLGLLFFGVHDTSECPLMIQPSTVVVRYGDPVSVNCTVLGYYEGIGWEASEGSVGMVSDVQFVTWSLETLTDWEIRPRCFGNFLTGPDSGFQCEKKLNITVYKPPDSVSISAVNHAGPMLEGEQYQLQCEVQNIAPVQYLTVKWYKGETLENQTSYDALTKTPVNVSSTLLITPIGADDGAQYSCVAELELGPEGPQPPPEVKSDPFNIIVHYTSECPLMIQPSTVVVRYGDPVSVNCTISGDHEGIGWEASEGSVDMVSDVQFVSWSLETLTDWETRPKCFANFQTGPDYLFQCEKKLKITVYKPPDSVSISAVNHAGPMLEGEQYQLQCEVQNIAPVQYLTVKWYKGETLETQTSYDALTKTPVNVSSTLLITPTSADDGAQYSCVAELELGPEGPQPPPSYKSDPLNITVKFCPLKMEPSTLVVRYGDPVSVNCTLSGVHEGIGWEASEGDVMVTDVQFVTWSLETLTDWEIRPKCFGNFLINGEPDQCAKDLNITVYKPSDSVSISVVNHTGPMLEGEQYQLQCEVQNIAPVQYLTVKWYKGETLENQTSYDALTKTPVNVSSTLLITPTSADDGVQYSCVAVLELGPEGPQPPPSTKSDPLNIPVHHKPRITECLDHVKLREGESLDTLVSCRAEGNPSPVVTWYRNQSEFNSSTQLTRRDAGQYVMMAKNTLGSVSVNFTVGYGPIFNCSHKYEVTANERHALRCRAEGFPLPEVTWFKEDEEVELPAQMTWEDEGQYILTARNAFGTANHSMDIDVLYPPSEIFEPESDAVDLGASVVLKCSSHGDPQPRYRWTYPRAANVLENSVDGVSLLHIFNASEENNGSYTCYAQNRIGHVNKTVSLIVRGKNTTTTKPPGSVSISAVNHTGPMLEGEQYRLQCEVQIIAPVQNLTVKWYKGGTENQTSYDAFTKTPVNVSSTLLITPTSADDGAQYSCVAELELGPSYESDPLNITVHYKPRITECPEYMKLTEGKSLDTLVSCKAEGNPPPMVTWYRNQSEFNSSASLTWIDEGLYVMTAENTLGSVNFTVSFLECPLKMEPSTVVVRYGDPVSVNCTVLGVHDGIGWEASEGPVDMVSDVQFVTWSLETLTYWETSPKCYGNFLTKAGPDQCGKRLNITVYKPPDSVSISAVNHAGPMLEQKQYQLQCEVQNIAPVQNLTVKWYKGETLENQTSYDALTKTPVTVSSTLLITPTSADDGVQYSCVAELELGPEGPQPSPSIKSDPLNITVHYKPRITECPDYVKLTEGESLDTLVSCRAEGNPSPVVTWYRDQSEFNGSTQLTRRDAGLYVMTAKNTLGSVSVNFTVGYKPRITECPDYVKLTEGESLDTLVSCRAEGNPSPVVTWYRDQSEFNSSTQLTRRDAGLYVMTAKNTFGSVSVNLTVGYAPIFYSFTNDTLEVPEGQEVALNCSAVGKPLPEYSWSSPHNEETFITSTSLPPGTHVYTCTAKNDLGESRKYFTVKVIVIIDYLPLIAGIVALAVVCISIAFVFIYLIYYKNTKMGEYNLKLGKPRTQNAHVAQNGKDSSLPMKKLTKPSLPV
ncbi:hemicentin-1-like isoform X2 [Anguilla rostrata]|uniref:hemicentin-1-like isoform X2 n=1 Tax=Anguilla rostrata TaxID=7938 RepID=UPI0030CE0BF7